MTAPVTRSEDVRLEPVVEPLVMNKAAAARYIACSAKALMRYAKQGLITPVMHGRRPMFLVADLKALVETLRADTLNSVQQLEADRARLVAMLRKWDETVTAADAHCDILSPTDDDVPESAATLYAVTELMEESAALLAEMEATDAE